MSNRAELLKSIVKQSDISEDASLDKYLLSRGINPKFATKDQKVAHSKTGQFIKWKKDHMLEGMTITHTPAGKRQHALKKSVHYNQEIRTDGHEHLHSEAVDKKDTVTLDIPLLIRVLELAREDIKTDMDLHRVVEKLINIRTKGMLTMKDYNYIAKIHEDIMSQVSIERIDEISKELTHSYFKKSIQDKSKENRKQRMSGQGRAIKRLTNRITLPDTVAKDYANHKPGQYVGDSVEHDGTPMVEAKSAALRFQQALQREKAKREEQERKDAESKTRAEKLLNPPKVNESDCACDDLPPQDKNKKLIQMSKSARIIKSIYKKKGVAEDTYDFEKDDKSTAPYGKKPKISTTNPNKSMGETKPDAAAVLTGGTTLTGQPRDTVEIDPMMRKRPGPDVPGKKN